MRLFLSLLMVCLAAILVLLVWSEPLEPMPEDLQLLLLPFTSLLPCRVRCRDLK
jgi:hypothetical protein